MKAYKKELSHFYSNKKQQDGKLKNALANKSFEDKKDIISRYRETKLEQGVFTINSEHQFERRKFCRDVDYLELLNEDIKRSYLEFNQYKYNVLYDLIDLDEARYDELEAELAELKINRDKYISNKSEKQTAEISFNDEIDLNMKQLKDSFDAAEKEDKKQIYNDIILLRKSRFDKLEPYLSMLRIGAYNTLVTDYVPIRGNEKKIARFRVGAEEEVHPEELEDLEPETLVPNESNESSKSSQSSKSSKSSQSKQSESSSDSNEE
jgi:hypothetical protein